MHHCVARLAIGILALGVALSIGAAAAASSVPHPTSGDVVVLRVTTVAPAGERGGPTVTIRGDGAAVIQPALGGPGHASPEPLVFRIDEAGRRRVLRGAAAAGLLRHTDYGQPAVTDHRSTLVEVDAGPGPRQVRVDGLADSHADAGLPAWQRSARAALRVFAGRVTDPSFYRGTLAPR